MKLKTVLLIAAGTVVVYVTFKAYKKSTLLGNINSSTDAQKIQQPLTEDRKIFLNGLISNIEAKLNGVIETTESKVALQTELTNAQTEISR